VFKLSTLGGEIMLNNLKKVEYKNDVKVGDWIYLENHKGEYYIAYITNVSRHTLDVFVIDYLDENGELKKKLNKPMRYISWSDYAIYLDKKEFSIIDLKDKTDIINLTLDLRDENWFNELAN
jgi:hypothetical protein